MLQAFHAFASDFLIGAAKHDITGPAAEVGMMGYGSIAQVTRGIHTRLYSRAFVFETADRAQRLAYVTADLALVSQAVQQEVVRRLAIETPGKFTDANLILSATHTHAGPGGYSHYVLYDFTTLGFISQNFEAVVSGITRSVVEALRRVEPGDLHVMEDLLPGVTVNRSFDAFAANLPHVPGVGDHHPTYPLMTQIVAQAESGKEIGILNWFPVHATSMSRRNTLISSDNKGYAALLFEKTRPGTIAAFANADQGDVSPDIYDEEWNRRYDDLEATRLIGEAQYRKALELFERRGPNLSPVIETRHAWIRMPGLRVRGEFTGQGDQALCLAGLGYSFAAGAEDGPSGLPVFKEGMKQGEGPLPDDPFYFLYRMLGLTLFRVTPEDNRCHFPKPVLISAGRQTPVPWTPDVIPFQLARIGELVMISVPAEITTMAGRILRADILRILKPIGVRQAVIAGLANSYSSYLTTFDEYQIQSYEGASTLYGPHTFAAYRQVFADLARSLVDGAQPPESDQPRKIEGEQIELQPGVVFDDKRLWERYGGELSEPLGSYQPGGTLEVSFRTGHPKNDLRIGSSYFEIQRQEAGRWETVAREGEEGAVLYWKRSKSLDCLACSKAVLSWRIPEGAREGTYRVVHRGARRRKFTGKIVGFEGISHEFQVQSGSPLVYTHGTYETTGSGGSREPGQGASVQGLAAGSRVAHAHEQSRPGSGREPGRAGRLWR